MFTVTVLDFGYEFTERDYSKFELAAVAVFFFKGGLRTEQIKAYIEYEKKAATSKTAFSVFAFSFLFSLVNCAVCFLTKEHMLMIGQLLLSAVSFCFTVIAFARKKDHKIAILSNAVNDTYLSVTFIFFSYLVLLSSAPVSYFFLLWALLFCLFCAALIQIIMWRRIKNGAFMKRSGVVVPSVGIGIMGGALGFILMKVFAAGADYETIVAVAVVLSLAVSAFASVGTHLYMCFYFCVKYHL